VTKQPHNPDSTSQFRLRPETIAVTAGRPDRVVDAPLNPPVVFASTYIGAHEVSTAKLGYGRYGNPTWQALEQAIGALEGGRALSFSSGMAAAHAVLELMPPRAVVVIPHNCYLGVADAVDRRQAKDGWQVRRVNVAETPDRRRRRRRSGVDRVTLQSDDRSSRPASARPQSRQRGDLRGR
jgi:cystathionine gamma-synthase